MSLHDYFKNQWYSKLTPYIPNTPKGLDEAKKAFEIKHFQQSYRPLKFMQTPEPVKEIKHIPMPEPERKAILEAAPTNAIVETADAGRADGAGGGAGANGEVAVLPDDTDPAIRAEYAIATTDLSEHAGPQAMSNAVVMDAVNKIYNVAGSKVSIEKSGKKGAKVSINGVALSAVNDIAVVEAEAKILKELAEKARGVTRHRIEREIVALKAREKALKSAPAPAPVPVPRKARKLKQELLRAEKVATADEALPEVPTV